MSEKNLTAPEDRVVITIDGGAVADATLQYAVSMAAQLQRPLLGVFIEDADLLDTAELPFSTEICLSTGQPQHFDAVKLREAFSDILKQFEHRLAHHADSMSVRWSISSIRGRRRDFYLDQLTDADCCIYAGGYSHASLANVKPARSNAKHLLVIDGADSHFHQTLASLLAPLKGNQLTVSWATTSSAIDSVDINAVLPTGTHIHFIDQQQLQAALQQTGLYDYVIIPRQRWSSQLAPLLTALGCPLIVM